MIISKHKHSTEKNKSFNINISEKFPYLKGKKKNLHQQRNENKAGIRSLVDNLAIWQVIGVGGGEGVTLMH